MLNIPPNKLGGCHCTVLHGGCKVCRGGEWFLKTSQVLVLAGVLIRPLMVYVHFLNCFWCCHESNPGIECCIGLHGNTNKLCKGGVWHPMPTISPKPKIGQHSSGLVLDWFSVQFHLVGP
jgi:hypothetical protein